MNSRNTRYMQHVITGIVRNVLGYVPIDLAVLITRLNRVFDEYVDNVRLRDGPPAPRAYHR
jgi:hypothetical protein